MAITVKARIAVNVAPAIDARKRLQQVYNSQVGVRERTGKNDGPEVEHYLRYVGLGRGKAWCAAFVSWAYGQAGMLNPKTAWSPALFPLKRIIWEQGSPKPRNGDVFGIYFSEIRRIGHCGFVDGWEGYWCLTVEGNTNDAGPVEGVYRKKRLIKTIDKIADWITPINKLNN